MKWLRKQAVKRLQRFGMMLWQGARAFELWTGQEMPVEHVKEQMF